MDINIDEATAVPNDEISKPGTKKLVRYKSKTLITKAKTPNVNSVIGIAIIWITGLINIFIIPRTTEVTSIA